MGKITLYHNTTNDIAIKISKEGIIAGLRQNVYGKGSEAEGAGIWCVSTRGYGYGGATITFQVDENDELLTAQNDTEYILYRNVAVDEIIDIDLQVTSIPVNGGHGAVESEIPIAIKKFGIDKILSVFKKNESKFISPYDYDTFVNLVRTGNKYCKGTIKVTESKKVQENLSIDEFIEQGLNDGTSWDTFTKLKWLRGTVYKNIRLVGRKINNSRYDYERNNLKRTQDFYKEVLVEIDNRLKDMETKKESKLMESTENKYPDKIYHFTNIDNTKSILKSNELKANEYNLICCTDIENFRNFKTNANVVRFTIYTNNLPEGAVIEKDNPIDGHNVESENEWVINLTNCSSKYLDITDTNLIQIEYSPELQKNNVISNTLRKKLEEASRNELLAKSKAETITRYNKSAGYKGFSLVDIDTTAIKTRDSIVITNRVGDYFDSIELDDILYWVGLEVAEARDSKMTQKIVEKALLGAMDGMDIKVDCNCGDFVYRFAYMATQFEYKYGKPENRPSNITNPDGYGAMCKHLIALLSNKSWVRQVASTLQQWIIDEIDWVRDFLKMSEEEFQIPDEYARYLGKHGAMKKFWDKQPDNDGEEQDTDIDETNEDSDSDNENDEAINNKPETEKTDTDNEENEEK